MEKRSDAGGSNCFSFLPTPLRRDPGNVSPASAGEDAVDIACEHSEHSVPLYSAEQARAHEELIMALAAQLGECEDSSIDASEFLEKFQRRLALAIVVLVAVLLVFTPLVLLFSSVLAVTVTPVTGSLVQHMELSKDLGGRVEAVSAANSSPLADVNVPSVPQESFEAVLGGILPSSGLNRTEQATYTPLDSNMARPNVSDRIQLMWTQGRALLQHSNCNAAEQLFASALLLLEEGIGDATSGHTLLKIDHKELARDRAFAMICAFRFKSGAEILEQLMVNASSVHANALGYAHFNSKDYNKAGAAFELGLKTDPHNKIIWNNLAAARLLFGDIIAADDAMYNALDPDNMNFQSDPWFSQLFMSNVNVIAQHAAGQKTRLPSIEIWYAPS